MLTPTAPTLADVLAPRARSLATDALWVLAGTALTIVTSKVVIPLPDSPVPITGQTFAVLLSGAVLGARRGFASQAIYTTLLLAGLPVGAPSTTASLFGPTAGYAMAFPLAAGLVGLLAQRSWDRSVLRMFVAMLLGTAVIYALGLANLARFLPPADLLRKGMLYFLPGDLIKCALAAGLLPGAWRAFRSRHA